MSCLTIVILILITGFWPHSAGLHQETVLVYWVGLFVPLWLLLIGVSQTSLMVGGFRSKELLVLLEEETDPSVVRCGNGGTNSPSQWINTIAWWRTAVCGRNMAINIKVTFMRQMILKNPKSFAKHFSHQNEAYLMPSKRKKMRQEKRKKKEEERKWKVKVKTAGSLLNPKTISKFCFLHMPKLRKLIFCIWIRRPGSVWPVNGFVAGFSSL